jgi:ABC-type multidrug transport system ATPase subunit
MSTQFWGRAAEAGLHGLQVMQALKELAKDGHTVVVAIHQPRSRIFELFDDLLLLSSGRCAYRGAASMAVAHFEKLGHICPTHYNPAEFLADLISRDQSSKEALTVSEARITKLLDNAPGVPPPSVNPYKCVMMLEVHDSHPQKS